MGGFNRVIDFMRASRIKTRLLVVYILVTVVPLACIGIFAYRQYQKSIEEKLGESTMQFLSMVQKSLSVELEKFFYIDNSFAIEPVVQQAFAKKTPTPSQALVNYMESKIISLDLINGVTLLNLQGDVLYQFGESSIPSATLEKVYTDSLNEPNKHHIAAYSGFENEGRLLVNRCAFTNEGKIVGYVVLVIDEPQMEEDVYGGIDVPGASEFLVMENDATVVTALGQTAKVGEPFQDLSLLAAIEAAKENETPYFRTLYDAEQHFIVHSIQPETGWSLAVLIPESYINSEIWQINTGIVVLCGASILFSVLLLSLVTVSIDRPVKKLVSVTRRMAEGNFPPPVADNHSDELAYLTQQFNDMVSKMQLIQARDQELNEKKREAEIKMLQTQINPHFLFNTLTSLRWVAMMNGDQVVMRGLDSLAQVLKGTLADTKEEVSLREEIYYLKQYAYIQKLRYGDSFSVEYQIPKELESAHVLKFLLQPILENAILHGGRGDGGKVHIVITAGCEENTLLLTLEDDGCGFSMTEKKAEPEKKKSGLSGIGLANVRERIRINFGSDYGVVLESVVNQGTRVKLTLPYRREEE